MKYDYILVGAGLYSAVCAQKLHEAGKKVLVIEKRNHIAGNIYTERIDGIDVHKYGAHIFHTNDIEVWNYIRQFGEFNRYTNTVVAFYKGEMYSLPFNMYTFNKLWGVITPWEAKKKLEEETKDYKDVEPSNLEEQAIKLVGKTIYERLIKGYTEKQWGRACTDLPAFIIKRLPLRLTYDNNYFNAAFQGIPFDGYTALIEKMLDGVEVMLNTDYFDNKEHFDEIAEKIIFTGPIDRFYEYKYGELEYRSVRFETETLDTDNYQGNAVVNYTDKAYPYTRIIEHKWFNPSEKALKESKGKTIISKEYSSTWTVSEEPYYPVNDKKNEELYKKYLELSAIDDKVIFGGRLGQYKYYDMDKVISEALALSKRLIID
ncbi:MAG: UDP-galactopyranose mutase [Lachnospiraceae bacterium]|nr:UDP-galactopyranose mutase [Lachnospiraceae bacterium]